MISEESMLMLMEMVVLVVVLEELVKRCYW